MSNLRKRIEISDDPQITLKRIDEPYRGTCFFNGPVLLVETNGATIGARKLVKLAAKVDRARDMGAGIWDAAIRAAEELVEDADGTYRFRTGLQEGLGRRVRNVLVSKATELIKEYYEQEY